MKDGTVFAIESPEYKLWESFRLACVPQVKRTICTCLSIGYPSRERGPLNQNQRPPTRSADRKTGEVTNKYRDIWSGRRVVGAKG